MENSRSSIKKVGFIPGLFISLFIVGVTLAAPKVQASSLCCAQNASPQSSWWVGGPGYYGNYYGGWGYNRGPVCGERCWRNRWGNIRCATNCLY